MRKHLLAKLDLLKALEGDAIVVPPSSISDRSISVDEDTSPGGSLLHELALRAVTARMSWSPRDCPPILSLSSNLIHFDSLPLTLDGYTEDVVIRTAEMLVGDEVRLLGGCGRGGAGFTHTSHMGGAMGPRNRRLGLITERCGAQGRVTIDIGSGRGIMHACMHERMRGGGFN